MIRKFFIFCILISLLVVSIFGCGENSYNDKVLKMTVQRLDSDLKNRWSTNGVIITDIAPGGPADKAGLEVGELISHLIGERKIQTVRDYKSAIKKAMDKDKKAKLVLAGRQNPVEISVRKIGEKLGLKVKLENKGLPAAPNAAQAGVTITEIKYESPAYLAELKVGDVILKVIDEKQIKTLKDYKKAVKEIAKYSDSLTVSTSELSGIKLAAIEALGNLGDSRGLDDLMSALESDNPKDVFLRRPAAKALEKLSEKVSDERLVDLMIKHLQPANEPDPEIRRSSAIILGKIKSKKAIPHLIATLEDKIPGVRFKAGIALAEIGPDAVDALIDALQHGSPSVQNIAASALGDIGGKKSRQALIKSFNKIQDSTVKLTIADALVKIGDRESISVLEKTKNSTTDTGLKVFIEELLSKSKQL